MKRLKKLVLPLSLVGMLALGSVNVSANTSQDIRLKDDTGISYKMDDPSKLTVIEGDAVSNNERVFVGKNLFTMQINYLDPNSFLNTKASGKSVTDDQIPNCNVGIYSNLTGKAKVGLCVYSSINSEFKDVGSTTVNSGSVSDTFRVSFPYNTAYGFVTNKDSKTISGSVKFLSLE